MDRLSLSKDAHLYMQRKGRVDGLKVWESVSLFSLPFILSLIIMYRTMVADDLPFDLCIRISC